MTRNERLNRQMRHLERPERQGDDGQAIERLLDAVDAAALRAAEAWNPRPAARMLMQLMFGVWLELNHRGYLVRTFDLICLHRGYRDESIAALLGTNRNGGKRPPNRKFIRAQKATMRKYFRHLSEL